MKIQISQEQLTAMIEHLGALVFRYESEAASFSAIGESGCKIAEERLQAAREADEIQSYLLHK